MCPRTHVYFGKAEARSPVSRPPADLTTAPRGDEVGGRGPFLRTGLFPGESPCGGHCSPGETGVQGNRGNKVQVLYTPLRLTDGDSKKGPQGTLTQLSASRWGKQDPVSKATYLSKVKQ